MTCVQSFLILLAVVLAGCGQAPPDKREFVVAAAADLRFALDEIAGQFQKQQPAVPVKVVYGSSGHFAAQIENGAPYDVFFSADVAYPQRLAEKGLAVKGSEFRYAVGRIAVWVPSASPIDLEKLKIDALRHPSVRHIAIANPGHAPYGKAAVAAMKSLGVYEDVKGRLAFGENVSQTLQYVQAGSADIGIVALSLALAPSIRETGRYWELPLNSYPRVEQGGVILASTKLPETAIAFRTFVLSDQSRTILQRYGFSQPAE